MTAIPQVESLTVQAVRSAREAAQRNWESVGIPAGNIGEECEHLLWLELRWAYPPEVHDGQKLRRFETGNREEDRIVADLKAAGFSVADKDEAGKQFKVSLAGGHLRGKTDGRITGIPEAPKALHILECKGLKSKRFVAAKEKGVQQAEPKHYAQIQTYLHAESCARGLYYIINTDTDDEHSERVEYDPTLAIQLVAKAERIVTAPKPPACTCPPYFLKAGYGCARHDPEAFPRRNCRTCLHATPKLDGDARWVCERFGRDLTLADQRSGCPRHLFIPDIVPGEQIDADLEAETVLYRLADGSEWRDGDELEATVRADRSPNDFGVTAADLTGAFV